MPLGIGGGARLNGPCAEFVFMTKQLRAIFILAAMIALPIVADNLISRRPDVRLFQSFGWPWYLTYVLIGIAVTGVVIFLIYQSFRWQGYLKRLFGNLFFGWGVIKQFDDSLSEIQSWVRVAERELMLHLTANWDQAGRVGKVRERAEWAAMANPEIFPSIFHVLKDPDSTPKDANLVWLAGDAGKWRAQNVPVVQAELPEAFGKLATDAYELNKTDMSNRGAAMGRVTWMAVLLRDVYQSSYGRAKAKLKAELDSGGTPYVPPGLKELFGFGIKEETVDGKTVKSLIFDPPHDYIKLKLALRQGQFPKELLLKDKDKVFTGWETIWKLTQQAPPDGWVEPAKAEKLPTWKLWFEYEQECWEESMTPTPGKNQPAP
jgi:hypothetical protein